MNQFNTCFSDCHFAKFLLRVVQVTFNIDVPVFLMNKFNDWANCMGPQMRKALLIGASTLC
jgi:hypothetical protein